MSERTTKMTFTVAEDVAYPSDQGDNEMSKYSLEVKASSTRRTVPSIEKLKVAFIAENFGSPKSEPENHPVMSKCLKLRRGDLLIAEYNVADRVRHYLYEDEITSLALMKDKHFHRLKGVPVEWIYQEMVNLAIAQGIPLQASDTWFHSQCVYRFAAELAKLADSGRVASREEWPNKYSDLYRRSCRSDWNEHEFSSALLEKLCFAHDIGRMFTGSSASKSVKNGLLHGCLGARHFRSLISDPSFDDVAKNDLELLARVCERHTGGSGLTGDEMARHEVLLSEYGTRPEGGLLAESPYEKLIGYADWRTHAAQIGNAFVPVIVSEEEAMDRTKAYGSSASQLKAVQALLDYVRYITDCQCAGL